MAATKTHAFSAEIAKVLKLMIHSLYTNKDIFLRELISNASDACDKLRYEALSDQSLLGEDSDLKITLTANEGERTLTIRDNGIGMNEEDLINNLGTIAKSGTGEFMEKLTGDATKDTSLIGQFGVGFYASYMVADKVTVRSRKAGEKETWQWESEGEGEFTVESIKDELTRGTEITLHLRSDSEEFADKHRISHIAQTYSDHISFPIEFTDEEGETTQLNQAAALWTRAAKDISEEQYKEFYSHVSHQPDEPWATLHNKIEGNLSYTNLLYIPSMRPFDLFNQERRRRVKLYVKRVFITDENVEIVPAYLRFLRGVVDSEDLPLNISRETLQQNPMLQKIQESITKKVLTTLKKKAEKTPEEYQTFWQNFGPVLKEGLCEQTTMKERILETCLFDVSEGDGQTSLDHYIEQMKEDQDCIYYLTGEKLETLQHHPQLEGFKKHGIKVLLLHDHVDDFWVNVVNEYKGKSFKSVTKASNDLDKYAEEEKADKEEEKTEEHKEIQTLLPMLKEIYGEAVKEVRTTNKLSESPVCLAVGEGDMDIRMERFLRENKQLPDTAYAKILEINPDHSVIKALAENIANEGRNPKAEDMAWLLLDQAKITEGEELSDPAAFSRRLTQFLSKGLAA
jgi:molecular chaperone HtpG